jgi:hypothetical protein
MDFHGADAEEYATAHLIADERRAGTFSCPDTGKQWVLEWPEPEQARLRAESPT